MNRIRKRYLSEWGDYVTQAAHGGHLGKKPIQIRQIRPIAGPRAGALELSAGISAGRLLKALSADDSAVLRQFIPWNFTGEPLAYMRGRYVRIEAGWPGELAESVIRLDEIGQYPQAGGRWLAGKNERGQVVTLGLSDSTPHFLLAGQTGSGKSMGMLAAACQLGQDHNNQVILLDGKYGVDLSHVAHLSTLVGPLVTDAEGAQAALAWAMADMRRRYEHHDPSRLVIFWDEPQNWLADSPALVEMTRRLLAQGRGANVHMILSTQHPVVSVFGDPTSKRNLTGRIALKVADFEASRVAVGAASPRADRLLGAGDCYAVTPGAVHRIQGVYVDRKNFEALLTGEPTMDAWPEYAAGDLSQAPGGFSGVEIGISILAAHQVKGRPTLRQRVQDATGRKPGNGRASRLLGLGRDALGWLSDAGWGLCETGGLPARQEYTHEMPRNGSGSEFLCV